MKKRTLLALVSVGLVAGAQAADQYMGNGVDNPISITGALDWNSTSNFWMSANDGTGTYGTWVDGNNALLNGDSPIITVTEAISVANITREADDLANDDGRADYSTTGSGSLTINGTFDNAWAGNSRQINFGAANSAANAMNWGGDITLGTGVNRFLLTSVQTIAAGSSITASAGNTVRLSTSESTDLSNLEVILNGGTFQNWNLAAAPDVTLGALTGTGAIDNQDTETTTIGSISVGDASTIGLLTGDMAVVMGTGTHGFDLLSLSGVQTADNLTGASVVQGGDLVISLLGGSDALQNGDTFDLFGGTLSGSFNSIDYSGLGLTGALDLDTSALGTTGVVTVIPEAATLGLVVAMGGGILFIRRRFMI